MKVIITRNLQSILDEKAHPTNHTEQGVRYLLGMVCKTCLGKRFMIAYLNKAIVVLRQSYD